MPRIYATSILASDMNKAARRIEASPLFTEPQRLNAKRIVKSLISSRSIAKAGNDDAESRVDYLADILGLTKEEVITAVNLMRREGILADTLDMSAYILATEKENRAVNLLERFAKLELFFVEQLKDDVCEFNLKELNEQAEQRRLAGANVKNFRTLIYYYTIKKYIQKNEWKAAQAVQILPLISVEKLKDKINTRIDICRFVLKELFAKAAKPVYDGEEMKPVEFSLVGLFNAYKEHQQMDLTAKEVSLRIKA